MDLGADCSAAKAKFVNNPVVVPPKACSTPRSILVASQVVNGQVVPDQEVGALSIYFSKDGLCFPSEIVVLDSVNLSLILGLDFWTSHSQKAALRVVIGLRTHLEDSLHYRALSCSTLPQLRDVCDFRPHFLNFSLLMLNFSSWAVSNSRLA